MKKNILKISIFCLISGLLFSFLNILYNKGKEEVFAQEYKATCDVKIPIGEAVDETEDLLQEIINTIEVIIQASNEAANAGEALTNLADQCKAENCQSGCREWCEGWKNCGETTTPCVPYCHGNPPTCWTAVCGQRQCGEDEEGKPIYCPVYCLYCRDFIEKCEISGCSGDPCPTAQINEKVRLIEDNYLKIKVAYEGGEIDGTKIEGIKNLIKRPAEIFPKLGESRNKLKACSVPPEDYEKYLSGEEMPAKLLLNCGNAKQVDPSLGDCHPNNYFCCE